jgi:hypothetical protein
MGDTAVRTSVVLPVAMMGLWLGVACAESQTTRKREMGPAVFGLTGTRADKPGGLDLYGQLFASYDDDVLAEQSVESPRPTESGKAGLYPGFSVGLQYFRPGRTTGLHGWASSALNYYPNLNNQTTTFYDAGLSFEGRFGSRFTLHASPFVTYSPHYSMQMFLAPLPVAPGDDGLIDSPAPAAPDVDSTVIQRRSLRYGGNTELRMLTGKHSNVSVGYGYTKTDTTANVQGNFDVQSIGVNYGHELTSSARLMAGYSFQESTYEDSADPVSQVHSLNIGVNYRKPLSRSRRTFLRIKTGSVIADQTAGQTVRVTGLASLVHQMGRTWSAQGQYRRQVGYIDGFVRPVFSDSVNAGIQGLITRRVDFEVSANYITGTDGLGQGSARFSSYSGSARVRRAFTRTLAGYVQYLFYHYNFDEAADRPVGLPQKFNRNGVRVGLSMWLPLFD